MGCAQKNIVPRDFYLVARYGAARAWFHQKSWTLTIPVDGNALQEWNDWGEKFISPTPMKSYTLLSQNDLKEIVISIKKSDFFNIPRDPYLRVPDLPVFVLSVTMDGKSNEVRMSKLYFVKHKHYAERLLPVWDTILKKVPSPNKNIELKFRQ